jgi:enoyl-CoA hydratase/carnithine racemase
MTPMVFVYIRQSATLLLHFWALLLLPIHRCPKSLVYLANVLVLALDSDAAAAADVVVAVAVVAVAEVDVDIVPESASGYSDEIVSLLSSWPHLLHLHYR